MTWRLCQDEDEDIDHLFFECSSSAGVWTMILAWKGIKKLGLAWHNEVQWALKHMKGKSSVA
ncbi:hypothetical protein RDI58_000972 [Solanum bulbocastanum]|uniref:Reverse transcriptase zinc-binding domain-containing protein n=1 Tax=Solanum bulbocastanum TaxID=147425 RepID=A0AAN8YMS2_SOLBU